jgi:hypothetical protein
MPGLTSILSIIQRRDRLIFLQLLFVLMLFLPHVTLAQNVTWNGSVSSDWFTAANWSNNQVPTSSTNVTIPWLAASAGQPVVTANATVNTITMQSQPNTLTVGNGVTLTVNGNLTTNNNAVLTGGTNSSLIVGGDLLLGHNANFAGSNNLDVDGKIRIANGKTFDADFQTITAGTQFELVGTMNFFTSTAEAPTITINNNGLMDVDNATVTLTSASTNSGSIQIDNGTLNILGDFTLTSSGSITVQTGTINVGAPGPPPVPADFTQSGGSTLNLNNGSFNVYGSSTFTGGGTFNAGDGDILFQGDVAFNGGSDFNADNSTVILSGDVTLTSNSNQSVTFWNLVVDENTSVEVIINVTVINSMEVDETGEYGHENNTTLNVIGDVIGDPQILADPYIISITIVNSTTIELLFNMDLNTGPAETPANYKVRDTFTGAFADAAVTGFNIVSATLSGSNPRIVTVVLGSTIQIDVNYYLWVQNITESETSNNRGVSNPHRKLFVDASPPTFYSRANGNWNVASSWSIQSHTGSSAPRTPGQGGDQVIIGNGNTITVNSNVTIAPLASITVDATGILTVNSDGNFITGSKTVTGAGNFELQSGGSLSIGSADGIASSGATGSIQTGSRSFSAAGNYTYNGDAAQVTGTGLPTAVNDLTINNAAHVELTANVQVDGTLRLEDGDFIILSGFSIVAPDQDYDGGQFRALRELFIPPTDTPGGWRLYSSPIDTDHANLFSELTTQGYTGSSLGTTHNGDPLMPSVLWYLETFPGTDNQRWRALSNASDATVAGRGLFTYVFGNISTDTRYNQTSVTLDVRGEENQGDIDLNVTYTAAADTGWNLVGNPYLATIDWDNTSGWSRTNMDGSIYIWDAQDAEFKTWNGSTGSLGNGLIKPFQGFWVKANDDSPSLEVNQAAKTTSTGGTFYRHHPDHYEIVVSFDSGELRTSTFVMFSEDARSGLDRHDAYRLRSLSDTFIEAYTVNRDGDRLAINNLPSRFSRILEIPMNIDGLERNGGLDREVALQLDSRTNIPSHWQVEIIDNRLNKVVASQNGSGQRYQFQLTTTGRLAKGPAGDPIDGFVMSGPEPILSKSRPADARFTIRITPTELDPEIPTEFGLNQNYPNPFNPTTRIPYRLAEDGPVRLEVYDLTGRLIATLVDGYFQAGHYEAQLDASRLASGIYLYRMVTVEGVFTRRMTFLK